MTLRSHLYRGELRLEAERLVIDEGGPGVVLSYREMTFPTETFRVHFLCRMVRVIHRQGSIFFTVGLIGAFGVPIVSSSTAVIELQAEIDARFRRAWQAAPSGSQV